MTWLILAALAFTALIALGLLYPKIRASTNFRAAYARILRLENDKQYAISTALSHLATFLPPFTGFTGKDIDFLASEFASVEDPPSALQPLLQRAESERSLAPLIDRAHVLAWKAEWMRHGGGLIGRKDKRNIVAPLSAILILVLIFAIVMYFRQR